MDVTEALYKNLDRFSSPNPRVTDEYYNFVKNNKERIQEEIDYDRDYLIDFFGIKTLERAYLIRVKTEQDSNVLSSETAKGEAQIRNKKGKIVERPQHMFMRVALAIHLNDIKSAFETYHMMSQKYFTHASPTLYNAGSHKNQMSSCYLLGMDDDLDSIADTFHDCMRISKWAGGIGIHLSDIRAKGSLIRGTNGDSEGIVPLIKTLNEIARYINQGGRRN
jgi:ribonucleotide reductase alpha subunit